MLVTIKSRKIDSGNISGDMSKARWAGSSLRSRGHGGRPGDERFMVTFKVRQRILCYRSAACQRKRWNLD
jgi:hypothetical protein